MGSMNLSDQTFWSHNEYSFHWVNVYVATSWMLYFFSEKITEVVVFCRMTNLQNLTQNVKDVEQSLFMKVFLWIHVTLGFPKQWTDYLLLSFKVTFHGILRSFSVNCDLRLVFQLFWEPSLLYTFHILLLLLENRSSFVNVMPPF